MLLASATMFFPIWESLQHISDRHNHLEVHLNGCFPINTALFVILGNNIVLR